MWSYQNSKKKNDWANLNVRANLSLDEIVADPRSAQAQMIPSKKLIWKPTRTENKGKELNVGAVRNLNQKGRLRDYKLGSTQRWAITFFDMSGPGAMSDIMPLDLTSGAESVETPKKSEKTKKKPVKKPIKKFEAIIKKDETK